MKFADQGIIISQRKYSENSLIVKIFSQHHGIYSGFVKSAKSKRDKAIFQIGNLVSFEFRSRVEENLGQFFSVDLVKPYCAKIIFNYLKLSCANSLFSIIDSFFLERENHQSLFWELQNFLEKFLEGEEVDKKSLLAAYIKLELKILATLGYGIDLSSCAATNSKFDLVFVSPKSARAVSFSAGEKYQNKLLPLPNFLVSEEAIFEEHHLLSGLELTGFFLKKFLSTEEFANKNFHNFFHRENIKKSLT